MRSTTLRKSDWRRWSKTSRKKWVCWLVYKRASYEGLKGEEDNEIELQEEIRTLNETLAKKIEENSLKKASIDYEINKNWIEFRQKKKELEAKNREFKAQLQSLKETFQYNTDILQQKNNASARYFGIKKDEIKHRQRFVS